MRAVISGRLWQLTAIVISRESGDRAGRSLSSISPLHDDSTTVFPSRVVPSLGTLETPFQSTEEGTYRAALV